MIILSLELFKFGKISNVSWILLRKHTWYYYFYNNTEKQSVYFIYRYFIVNKTRSI